VDTEVSSISIIKNVIIVQKNPGSTQFLSIKDAIDSITDASITNPYLVSVGPGIYTEDSIVMKSYVYINGSGLQVTIIMPSNPIHTIIYGIENSGVNNCAISGAIGSGGIGVYLSNSITTENFLVYQCLLTNCETLVHIHGNTIYTAFILQNSYFSCPFTTGILVTNNPGIPTLAVIENLLFQQLTSPYPTEIVSISGVGTEIVIQGSFFTPLDI
jgi:hypothetical protein